MCFISACGFWVFGYSCVLKSEMLITVLWFSLLRDVIKRIDQSEFEGFEYINPLLLSTEETVWGRNTTEPICRLARGSEWATEGFLVLTCDFSKRERKKTPYSTTSSTTSHFSDSSSRLTLSQTRLLVSDSSSCLTLSQTCLNLSGGRNTTNKNRTGKVFHLTRLSSLKYHPNCLPPSHHPLWLCWFLCLHLSQTLLPRIPCYSSWFYLRTWCNMHFFLLYFIVFNWIADVGMCRCSGLYYSFMRQRKDTESLAGPSESHHSLHQTRECGQFFMINFIIM